VGAVLILIGALALIDATVPGWEHSWRVLWPVFLVGVGVLLVVGAIRRDGDGPGHPNGAPPANEPGPS
jgi:hypothetical protein